MEKKTEANNYCLMPIVIVRASTRSKLSDTKVHIEILFLYLNICTKKEKKKVSVRVVLVRGWLRLKAVAVIDPWQSSHRPCNEACSVHSCWLLSGSLKSLGYRSNQNYRDYIPTNQVKQKQISSVNCCLLNW